ncbi:hypothetical protein CCH79_00020328 [Gambusia affinis]|uniref:Uncharacterized protein n=1 Tax=Gambusia affinis TaxID=33528 RepID=A0A315VRV2_GAMAF|nr:hypothetical protein CCH79_00020328 [Gambusia affinis]
MSTWSRKRYSCTARSMFCSVLLTRWEKSCSWAQKESGLETSSQRSSRLRRASPCLQRSWGRRKQSETRRAGPAAPTQTVLQTVLQNSPPESPPARSETADGARPPAPAMPSPAEQAAETGQNQVTGQSREVLTHQLWRREFCLRAFSNILTTAAAKLKRLLSSHDALTEHAQSHLAEAALQAPELGDEAQLLRPGVGQSDQAVQQLIHLIVERRRGLHCRPPLLRRADHLVPAQPGQRGPALLLQQHQAGVFQGAAHRRPAAGQQLLRILAGRQGQHLGWPTSSVDFLMSDGEDDGSFLSLPATAFSQRPPLTAELHASSSHQLLIQVIGPAGGATL